MIIMPAIDIRKGKCVMLTQGKVEKETIFSQHPVRIAQQWVSCGAQRLHIVDLDGAFSGRSVNCDIVQSIRKAVQVPIQLGGGIRDMDTLKHIISDGIDYAIIGTAAVKNPAFLKKALNKYGDRIVVAVDAWQGEVTVSGWTDRTHMNVKDVAGDLMKNGVKTILYTDVEKDGMMQGPNWDGIRALCDSVPLAVIASGGFSTIQDIQKLSAMNISNVYGVVIGKALYTGDINLEEAIKQVHN